MQAVTLNSVSSLVHVTRKSHEKCMRTCTFSCLLTFNAFGATLTTFTVFSEIFFLKSYVKQTTVFPRINAAAFIKFFMIWVRRLFEGGVYSRAAFIRGRRLFKMMFILLNNQP